jgi:lipoprotein-anchoring transpeptidase ErfK/SrfK
MTSSAGRWAGFVRRYGWRAYAVPVLAVVTVAVLVRPVTSSPATHAAARPARPAPASASAGAPAQQVEGATGDDEGFAAGATPEPVTITLPSDVTSCADNTYRRLVLVSISRQHLWACDGARQVNSTPVTTGKVTDHDQTPLGSWRVQAKQRDRYLVGPGYKDYVHYWVPFNGDFGLHDATWQTMPFGSAGWRTQGSHGCVHTPTSTMAWLYDWAEVGSTVVTIEK